MKSRRNSIIVLVFAMVCSFVTGHVQAKDKVTLTPTEARKIAKEAYIFNYPLVMMYRTMYLQAIDTKSGPFLLKMEMTIGPTDRPPNH